MKRLHHTDKLNNFERRKRIFELCDQGLTEKEIAAELNISDRTVRRDRVKGIADVALFVKTARDTTAKLSNPDDLNSPYIEEQAIYTLKRLLFSRISEIISDIRPGHLGQVAQLLKTLNDMQGGEQQERSKLSDVLRNLQNAQSPTDVDIID